MQKERINEIKKGLENEIYTKIKDIEVEEKDSGKFKSSEYVSTDYLADILPKKADVTSETIQIIDKNSVDLELDRDEVLQKYDDYLHDGEVVSSNEYDEKMDSLEPIIDDVEEISIIQKEVTSLKEEENLYEEELLEMIKEKKDIIPRFQTEEHLKIIEEDIRNVELRYQEEEKERFNELQKRLSKTLDFDEDSIGASINNEPNTIFPESNFQKIDYESSSQIDADETKVVSNEEISNMGNIEQVHLELSNDFIEEDDIILPDPDEIKSSKPKSIEDSQFIFEQDVEEDIIGEDFDKEKEEEFEKTYVNTVNPLQTPIENPIDEADDFWDEEEEEKERRFIDFILVVIIILLFYIVLKMAHVI